MGIAKFEEDNRNAVTERMHSCSFSYPVQSQSLPYLAANQHWTLIQPRKTADCYLDSYIPRTI